MATIQVSRLRKNWIVCLQPIKFEKILNQQIRAMQTYRVSMTVAFIFRKRKKLPNFSLNFSE